MIESRGRKRKIDYAMFIKLANAGYSNRAIMAAVGCRNYPYVSALRKKLGTRKSPTNTRGPKPDKNKINDIKQMRVSGMTWNAIAKKYKLTRQAMQQFAAYHGLYKPSKQNRSRREWFNVA